MATSNGARWLKDHMHFVVLVLVSTMVFGVVVAAEYGLRLVGYEYTRRPSTLVLEDSFTVQDRGVFVANPLSDKHAGLGVNSEGFRSPEFSDGLASAPRQLVVVVLGDSFTWGASASPITESFPDVLRKAGYRVHNLGIPGIGPRQYQRMAEEYLSRLKPDVVLVALYLGNDFLDGQWEPPPGRPPYYVLKGGEWIPTVDEEGNYIESIDVAYEHFHNKFGKTRRFLRETALGTLVIKAYRRVMTSTFLGSSVRNAWVRIVGTNDAEAANTPHADHEALLRRYAVTYDALRHIQGLTQKVGAKYYTLVLPALGPGCLSSADFNMDRQKPILDEFQSVYPDVTNAHYFALPDCHLNNAGHLVIARTLQKLLGTLSADPT